MTSAAYGADRDSVADGVAVDCQVSAFFATTPNRRFCPMKNAAPGTSRPRRGVLGFSDVSVSFFAFRLKADS